MKTIAIIGAMREEITPLLESFSDIESIELGGNLYHKAHYKGCDVIIAYSKIGKIHAALTCASMILHFKANCVIFTGVAGALGGDLHIGDTILATALCQHDVDITAFGHPLGFIPESSVFINTSESLNNIARNAAKKHNITLKSGIVASGDAFVFNSDKKQWIAENFNACAVEMEGASIAVVSQLCGIPFCVIRSISDSADDNASVSFDEFLEQSARKSTTLVLAMLDEIAEVSA